MAYGRASAGRLRGNSRRRLITEFSRDFKDMARAVSSSRGISRSCNRPVAFPLAISRSRVPMRRRSSGTAAAPASARSRHPLALARPSCAIHIGETFLPVLVVVDLSCPGNDPASRADEGRLPGGNAKTTSSVVGTAQPSRAATGCCAPDYGGALRRQPFPARKQRRGAAGADGHETKEILNGASGPNFQSWGANPSRRRACRRCRLRRHVCRVPIPRDGQAGRRDRGGRRRRRRLVLEPKSSRLRPRWPESSDPSPSSSTTRCGTATAPCSNRTRPRSAA